MSLHPSKLVVVGNVKIACGADVVGARTVSVAVLVVDPATAEIVIGVSAVTFVVGIAKLRLLWPCRTVTLEGDGTTVVLLRLIATVNPPAGAGPLKVTVPVVLWPPVTLLGLTETACSVTVEVAGGTTVMFTDLVTLPAEAVIATDVFDVTVLVWIVNVLLVCPCETVTLLGMVTAVEVPRESVTTNPPAGAGPLRVTVPVALWPPVILLGLADTA